MPVILKNNAFSTLATAITASDTAIVVADGSKFPALSAGEYFYATLVSPAGTTEIVKVTARVGNSMTVVRAQDGSSAASFQVGALVEMRVNAASIAEKAITTGSFSWNIPRNLPVNDTTPDVSEGSLWKEANTAATTITQFDGGREGQEIILTVTSGNTTLQNGANIKTNTGANKLLVANRAYRLVRANSAWWEI